MLRDFGFYLMISAVLTTVGCTSKHKAELSGHIDYAGSSEISIEERPLHYKFSEAKSYPLSVDNEGQFQHDIPVDSAKVYLLTIDEEAYPLYLEPGKSYGLEIIRGEFPLGVEVEGYPTEWDRQFAEYYSEDEKIRDRIEDELPAFREGNSSEVIELYKSRILLAKRFLGDSPFELYYHQAVGEYLVKCLEQITYARAGGIDPGNEREKVIDKAKKLNFFTYTSLRNQRAGIRDFTNAYANTFGVHEQLEEEYGQELTEYDVKRLGYEKLDSARVSVLDHIEERRALAYSKMHLIAERIGEVSPETGEESYREFLEEFDDFPEYTEFLTSFYEDVKSVSPGQPAVPFTLPNQEGEPVSMSHFEGKFVLLDFWASWCIPCLNEFDDMRMLYEKYDRDDFEIVAISTEADSSRWRQALDRFDNPWVQLYGGNEFEQETFKAYQGGGIPFYILINREGNIERHNDIRPSFNLEQVMDSLLSVEDRSELPSR